MRPLRMAWQKAPFSGRLIAVVKLKPIGVRLPVFRDGVIILKWARVADFEMLIEGKKIAEYRASARIYFDIER
jgi:hypothetical protein